MLHVNLACPCVSMRWPICTSMATLVPSASHMQPCHQDDVRTVQADAGWQGPRQLQHRLAIQRLCDRHQCRRILCQRPQQQPAGMPGDVQLRQQPLDLTSVQRSALDLRWHALPCCEIGTVSTAIATLHQAHRFRNASRHLTSGSCMAGSSCATHMPCSSRQGARSQDPDGPCRCCDLQLDSSESRKVNKAA